MTAADLASWSPAPATRAVYAVFILSGFVFASWASRIPQVRDALELTPRSLGLVLLAMAVGSVISMPLAGVVVGRLGTARTIVVHGRPRRRRPRERGGRHAHRRGAGGRRAVPPRAGLRHLGRRDERRGRRRRARPRAGDHAPLPRRLQRRHGRRRPRRRGHGGARRLGHGAPARASRCSSSSRARSPCAASSRPPTTPRRSGGPRGHPLRAWTEPRTLLIGLFVFTAAFTEGTGNDWLGIAVIDGYGAAHALGSLTFAVFLAAMTLGRWFGPGAARPLGPGADDPPPGRRRARRPGARRLRRLAARRRSPAPRCGAWAPRSASPSA